MQNDDNNKPGKALQPQQQNNLPAALATSKKLVQHLKTALAHSSRELAEDDGWVERLIRGLEAGINENTIIRALIKTANREEELDYLPRDKALWLALVALRFSGDWDRDEYSDLRILPAEISKLHNLRTLNLSWNKLATLPAEIGQLQNLQKLHLWSNQLTTLPAEIWQLQNLQELHLWNNQLTTLPAEIGQLQNPQELNLRGNQLTTLPAEIGQLQNLQCLDLWDNRLTTLPAEIGQLQNLQILNLLSNQLTTLPTEIGQLRILKSLDLRENPLHSLPDSLKRLYRERNGALTIELDNPALLDD